MAISFINSYTQGSGGGAVGNTSTRIYSFTVASGSLIVIPLGYYTTPSHPTSALWTSVTDNLGNTYSKTATVKSNDGTNDIYTELWYCVATNFGNVTSVSFTNSGGIIYSYGAITNSSIILYSGVSSVSSNNSSTNGATPGTSLTNTVTIANANSTIISELLNWNVATMTWNSGDTSRYQYSGFELDVYDNLIASTGSSTVSVTSSATNSLNLNSIVAVPATIPPPTLTGVSTLTGVQSITL